MKSKGAAKRMTDASGQEWIRIAEHRRRTAAGTWTTVGAHWRRVPGAKPEPKAAAPRHSVRTAYTQPAL